MALQGYQYVKEKGTKGDFNLKVNDQRFKRRKKVVSVLTSVVTEEEHCFQAHSHCGLEDWGYHRW